MARESRSSSMSVKKESSRPKLSAFIFLRRRDIIRFVVAALLFAPVSGCLRSSPDAGEGFVVALDAAPTQLDPRLATDAYSERIDHLLFSQLIRFDPEDRIIPGLAEHWEIEKGVRYTFHLRKGILFHDGWPLTSADVRYTFESILDPELGSPHRNLYDIIEKIETPDAATVRFILTRPYAPFLAELTRSIVPKHLARNSPAQFSSHPIGSGPFLFVRRAPDGGVELAGYSNYFEGSPPISKISFKVIPEASVRLLELEKGNVDLVQNDAFPLDALSRIQKNKGLKVIEGPSSTYSYLGFNLRDPILQNKLVRQAIAYAIDREEITAYIFRGLAKTTRGLLPPSHWAYTDKVSYYPYDPERSKRLLDEAGFPERPGPAPRFKLVHKTSQNELARRVTEVLQRQLGQVGIELEIRSYEWGTFYSDIKSGNFQTFTLDRVGVSDPDIYYQLFHSKSVPPAGANRGRYQNGRLDQLTEAGRITLDRDRRKELYEEVQQIVSDELPYISLWHKENIAVVKREVEGYRLYLNGDFYALREARVK